MDDGASCRNERGLAVPPSQPVPACEKALRLCYDAWWDGFECQVSNDTRRRLTTAPFRFQLRWYGQCLRWNGQCSRLRWVEHNFGGSIFCRCVVDTLASIKPAVVLSSTNNGVLENSAAVSQLLSFTAHAHRSNQSVLAAFCKWTAMPPSA